MIEMKQFDEGLFCLSVCSTVYSDSVSRESPVQTECTL